MELGVVGLGRMGRIVVDRCLDAGHDVVAFDIDADAREDAASAGATAADSLAALADEFGDEKRVWLMVPAGDPVDAALEELAPHLGSEDVVVDGGNSHFEDSTRRAESHEFAYLDCGTSGGPAGAELGFSLMVGGPEWAYDELMPVFDAVATGPEGHDRMGPAGSGHYVKMVHNGVEYALMQTYGEGFELLHEGRYDLDLEASRERGTTAPSSGRGCWNSARRRSARRAATSATSPTTSPAAPLERGRSRKASNRRSRCRSSTRRSPSGSGRVLPRRVGSRGGWRTGCGTDSADTK